MKLIVQIPCLNEADTLPATLADIPRRIEGIDRVEILIIDDGSHDGTAEVARAHGADHVIVNRKTLGLARTFRRGLEASLQRGADIIVNTDGDNQYAGADIAKLIVPLLEGNADIAVGDRQTGKHPEFSWFKRLLQRGGSAVVRQVSGVDVPDAVSGFRAISREAAIRINIVSSFSYTVEMLIQAGKKHLAVASVPITTNPSTRPSRLYSGMASFVGPQLVTIVRMYAMYQPLRVFLLIGTIFSVAGLIPIVRFLLFFAWEPNSGHVQSLILGGVLVTMGFVSYLVGLVADLINFNRQLIEISLEKTRRMELGENSPEGASPD